MKAKSTSKNLKRKLNALLSRVTVRKIKHRLYGVGALMRHKWTLLRCKPYRMQLLYPNIKKANAAAAWIRANRAEAIAG